jgi:dipeptidyl aminopeptidase/acylaminoacyl peptidase
MGPWVIKAHLEDEPEKFAAASPLDQIHPDAPPFLVVHGDKDTLAPVEGARDFVEELRAVSKAPVLYLELKGAQHAFEIFPSIRANHVVRAVARFLETVHADYVAGIAPEEMPGEEIAEEIDAVTLPTEEVTAS